MYCWKKQRNPWSTAVTPDVGLQGEGGRVLLGKEYRSHSYVIFTHLPTSATAFSLWIPKTSCIHCASPPVLSPAGFPSPLDASQPLCTPLLCPTQALGGLQTAAPAPSRQTQLPGRGAKYLDCGKSWFCRLFFFFATPISQFDASSQLRSCPRGQHHKL